MGTLLGTVKTEFCDKNYQAYQQTLHSTTDVYTPDRSNDTSNSLWSCACFIIRNTHWQAYKHHDWHMQLLPHCNQALNNTQTPSLLTRKRKILKQVIYKKCISLFLSSSPAHEIKTNGYDSKPNGCTTQNFISQLSPHNWVKLQQGSY